MNDCKHNWKESRFAQAHRKAWEYIFDCTRCGEYRYVVHNPAGTGGTVVHAGAAQPTTATQAGETTQAFQATAQG